MNPCLGPSLEWCDGNWKSASVDEPALLQLVEQETADGFVAEFSGTVTDARQQWPTGIAKGKLGIARSPGHADILLLDTTISGVNPMAIIPEKTMVPGPFDVRHHAQPNPDKRRAGLAVDVSKAHRRVKLAKADQGLMLFEVAGRLFYYLICHFGGSFNDDWWRRVAALIMDITHAILWILHGGHACVDDWLWRSSSEWSTLQACLVVVSAVSLGVPMSWGKLRLGRQFGMAWPLIESGCAGLAPPSQ